MGKMGVRGGGGAHITSLLFFIPFHMRKERKRKRKRKMNKRKQKKRQKKQKRKQKRKQKMKQPRKQQRKNETNQKQTPTLGHRISQSLIAGIQNPNRDVPR
jgi:FKBP-type peptidyl-prolyl cis-trans isomerase